MANMIIEALETESFPVVKDLPAILLFALFFPVLRYTLDRCIFQGLGHKYILNNALKEGVSMEDKKAIQKTHTKFKESCWKSTYYLMAEIFALAVTFGEPWAHESRMFWIGPGDQMWPDQQMKLKLKLLYIFVGGFYTYSIFAVVFWETRRPDFGVSLSHHIAAVLLIVFSYVARFGRITSLVVAIHDISDVFLELAKTNKYLKKELNATILFGLFAFSWFLCRMVYFPLHIIRSTSYEILQILDKEEHKFDGPILYYVFNTLLIMLLVMHVYWFVLILRVIEKQVITKSTIDDVRSDEDDD